MDFITRCNLYLVGLQYCRSPISISNIDLGLARAKRNACIISQAPSEVKSRNARPRIVSAFIDYSSVNAHNRSCMNARWNRESLAPNTPRPGRCSRTPPAACGDHLWIRRSKPSCRESWETWREAAFSLREAILQVLNNGILFGGIAWSG